MSSRLRIWHLFTNAALDPPPLRVVRAECVYLHTAAGRKILEAVSSWWVNLHGHANPRIAAAIAEQARRVVYVLPPYVISADELHRVYDVILEVIQTLF
jgi:adenosylmethionine-8-amino-7-oxononanoate aminotransferase